MVVFENGQYYQPITMNVKDDPDYGSQCSQTLSNVSEIVHFSDFRVQILNDIVLGDVCTKISSFLKQNIVRHYVANAINE